LERALEHWYAGQVRQALLELESSGRARIVERFGVRFWSAATSRYPNNPLKYGDVDEVK